MKIKEIDASLITEGIITLDYRKEYLFQASKAAMQALISLTPNNEKDVAVLSVKYAQALLDELDKK